MLIHVPVFVFFLHIVGKSEAGTGLPDGVCRPIRGRNGTMIKMIFSKLSNPFDELSSNVNELQDNMAKIKVYANTILFFRISVNMIFMILFILFFVF